MHFFDGGHFDAEEGDEIDDFAGFGERFEVIGAVMVAEAEDVNSFLFRFDRQQKGEKSSPAHGERDEWLCRSIRYRPIA